MDYAEMNFRCHFLNNLKDNPERPAVNSAIGPEYPMRIFGGQLQQKRMIRDKRRSLDRALLYSYQSAWIQILGEDKKYRALINPNKLKQDYDDKILSAGYELGLKPGSVFSWCNTNTYWLIYLQNLTEYAYFLGDIRRCRYRISWKDAQTGQVYQQYAAVRGPVETKINYIQKQTISLDEPNHSLHILMTDTDEAKQYFKRYARFYLSGIDTETEKLCWRVEATDSISTPGILELTAVEYYADEFKDDIEAELAESKAIDEELAKHKPNPEEAIKGETFIKPRKTYSYSCDTPGDWSVSKDVPVVLTVSEDKLSVTVNWRSTVSGQFELMCGGFTRTIVVESLF